MSFDSRELLAQVNSATNWYFGNRQALSFAGGDVSVLNDSQMGITEGGASWSDPQTGELVLYTDGFRVWDRTHTQMPGSFVSGTPVRKDFLSTSSTQSALILPHPGNPDQLYIFNAGNNTNRSAVDWPQFYQDAITSLSYQLISLSARGGLGDVIEQRVVRSDLRLVEKITANFAPCGDGFQIVCLAQDFGTSLYVWSLDESGLQTDPVISSFGGIGLNHEVGEIKFSQDGKYLAELEANNRRQAPIRLYEYDAASRQFNRPVVIDYPAEVQNPGLYSLAFAPDDCSFYTIGVNTGIEQYSLANLDATAIAASRYVHVQNPQFSYGALQIGPDGALYIFHDRELISRINEPNNFGANVTIEQGILNLESDGTLPAFGFPNFLSQIVLGNVPEQFDLVAEVDKSPICIGQPVRLAASGADSYRWEPAELFEDNTLAEQVISVDQTTEFTVTGLFGSCEATRSLRVEVSEPFELKVSENQSICSGETVSLFAAGADSYRWEPAELFTDNSLPNQELTLNESTQLTVTGIVDDCEVRQNIFVEVRRPLELTITADTTICVGQSLELFVDGATDYVWDLNNTLLGRNSANPTVSPSERTLYRVRGSRDGSCPAFAEVWVDVRAPLPEPIEFILPDTAAQPGELLRLPIVLDVKSATLPVDLPPIRLTIKSEAALLGFEGLEQALLVNRGVEDGQQIIEIELPAQRVSSKIDSIAFVNFLVYLNSDVETPLIIEDVQFLGDAGPGPCNPQAVTRSGRFVPHEYCLNYTIVWRKILRINATPNPASTEFTLFIQPAEGAADARIVVIDQAGDIFRDQRVNTPNADPLELQFDSSLWPIGVYIIRVQSGRTVRSIRLQIVR